MRGFLLSEIKCYNEVRLTIQKSQTFEAGAENVRKVKYKARAVL